MALRRREPKLRLRRWATDDWYFAHPGHRATKTILHHPIHGLLRMQIRGSRHLPKEGGVLLAPNHLSWADPFAVGVALDRPTFYLAKEGVFRNWFTRPILTAFGQIKVDRRVGGNEAAINTAVDLLKQGVCVGVFPEGTRSRPGHVKRGKTGVARIAALSGAPVLPIGCDTGAFWGKDRKLPHLGARVYVDVGAPIDLKLRPADAEDKQLMREATDRVMDEVKRLYRGCVAAREARERWE